MDEFPPPPSTASPRVRFDSPLTSGEKIKKLTGYASGYLSKFKFPGIESEKVNKTCWFVLKRHEDGSIILKIKGVVPTIKQHITTSNYIYEDFETNLSKDTVKKVAGNFILSNEKDQEYTLISVTPELEYQLELFLPYAPHLALRDSFFFFGKHRHRHNRKRRSKHKASKSKSKRSRRRSRHVRL
jgi:hypothetical protein